MRQAPRSKYNSSDGPRRRPVPVQDLSFSTSLPTSSAGGNRTDSYRKEASFGFVLSVKDTFGFIQPYFGEENLYFTPRGVREGDEVSYIRKLGPRGAYAQQVRLLPPPDDATRKVRGIIVTEADPYKDVPGVIEVSSPCPDDLSNSPASSSASLLVPYLHKGIIGGSKRLIRGDEVAANVYVLPLGSSSVVVRATRVSLLRSRKEVMIAEQVKAFQAGGVQMERGIIESIREGGVGGDFGFIKAETRAEHVYFRCDDILMEEGEVKLPNEMDEVEFYVIAEHVKGKLSNRAVCLRYLPHGTVQFEETLAESALGIVMQEAKASNTSRSSGNTSEMPGIIHLKAPIMRGDMPVRAVELWSRCIPDGFPDLRVGDEVSVDVTFYRPEKLFFARNLSLSSYRTLARDAGVIVKMKETAGFGFIRSVVRDIDVYFRLSDVGACDNSLGCLTDKDIKVGMHVSFDVVVDDSSSVTYSNRTASAPSRLKAVRIKNEPAAYDRSVLWKSGVRGIVEREVKRDGMNPTTAGIISVNAEEVLPNAESSGDRTSAILDATNCSTIKALEEIFSIASDDSAPTFKQTSIVLPLLTQRQVQAIEHIAKKHFHNAVSVKALESHQVESSGSSSLSAGLNGVISLTTLKLTRSSPSAGANRPTAHPSPAPSVSGSEQLTFTREAVSDIFGSVRKGGGVLCDVYIDGLTHSFMARNVRYDIPAEVLGAEDSAAEVCVGVVDMSSGNGGYIRVIPADEKLPWFVGALVEGSEVNKDLVPGSVVEAVVRTRAGIRYASSIAMQSRAENSDSGLTLTGLCTAVVVEGSRAVIVDASQCPLLAAKYTNLLDSIRQCSDSKSFPTVEGAAADEENKVYYPKLYYGRSVPARAAGGVDAAQLLPGAVIRCQAVVRWEIERAPVECIVVDILAPPTSQARLVGTIQNFRIRAGKEVELAELLTLPATSDENSADTPKLYYCDVRSLRENNANESLRIGDTVNFLAVPELCLAVLPVFIGRGGETAGSLPKRSPLNAMLKQTISSRGYKGITMAQGPPSDSAIGFEKGWKQSLPDISKLEWKSLVPHLLESN